MSGNNNLIVRKALEANSNSQNIKKTPNKAQNILYDRIKETLIGKKFSYWDSVYLELGQESISTMDISPCGTYIVTGSSDGSVKVINFKQKKEVFYISNSDLKISIKKVSFSHNSQKIFCESNQHIIQIWDFKSKILNFSISLVKNLPFAFSPDCEYFVHLNNYYLNFTSLIEKNKDFQFFTDDDFYKILIFSPDSKYIITYKNNTIKVWNISQREIESFNYEESYIYSLCLSSDSTLLATNSSDSRVTLWSFPSCTIKTFFVQIGIPSLQFSPDNKYLYGFCYNEMKVFSIFEKKVIFSRKIEQKNLSSIILTSDQKLLYAECKNSKIQIWSILLQLGDKEFNIIESKAASIEMSPNGKYIAIYDHENFLNIWNIETMKIVHTLDYSGYLSKFCIRFSDNNEYLIASNKSCIRIWEIEQRKLKFELLEIKFLNATSYDFRFITVLGDQNRVMVWDTNENYMMFEIFDDSGDILCTAFSPNTKFIACGISNGYIRLWNIKKEREEFSLFRKNKGIKILLFSDEGKFLLSSSGFRFIKVWNLRKKRLEFTLKGISNNIAYLKFLGNFLVSISDENFIIWNFQLRHEQYRCVNESFRSHPPTFSNDFKSIAQIIDNEYVCIWDLQYFIDSNKLRKFPLEFIPLSKSNDGKYVVSAFKNEIKLWEVVRKRGILSFVAHKNWVVSVSFSLDSKFILSGSSDCCVKAWDFKGCLLRSFIGHMDSVIYVGLSVNRKFVFSASSDRVIKVWDAKSKYEKASTLGFKEFPIKIGLSKKSNFIGINYVDEVVAVFKIK